MHLTKKVLVFGRWAVAKSQSRCDSLVFTLMSTVADNVGGKISLGDPKTCIDQARIYVVLASTRAFKP